LRDHAFGMPQRYDRFFKKTFWNLTQEKKEKKNTLNFLAP
jgi:hypothetical protein